MPCKPSKHTRFPTRPPPWRFPPRPRPSVPNLEAIEAVGAVPYVPFRSNNQGEGPAAWRRMWHLFSFRREEFLAHYHQRSNVESTFSAVKRLFGGSVRAKLPVAQKNEVLLKCLAYNLTVLVHSIYELGIEPAFSTISDRPVF